jgi:hypothetical protein
VAGIKIKRFLGNLLRHTGRFHYPSHLMNRRANHLFSIVKSYAHARNMIFPQFLPQA